LAADAGTPPSPSLKVLMAASSFLREQGWLLAAGLAASLAGLGLAWAGGLLSRPLERLYLDGPLKRTVRAVTFGGRVHETAVWNREAIPIGHVLRGPLIVEQMDATTVVDPGARLEVDRLGNLIITVGGGA